MKWPHTSLGEIFEIARGGSPRPIQNYLTDDPDGLNWIMIGDTTEGSKYISSTKNRIRPDGVRKSRMVKEGDFLLTNSMSFGRPYIMKTSGCIHDGWLVLSPKDGNVHSDFFYYLLGSKVLYREFSKRAAGVVVKNLNTNLVRTVEIPLPPLAEQKRIAAILDAADTLRAKRRESLAQLDTLLQSTFFDMFGDPLNHDGVENVTSFSEVISRITYGFTCPLSHLPEGIPIITAKNVRQGSIDFENCHYASCT
jgi:type I restriction enzyme, S subunit